MTSSGERKSSSEVAYEAEDVRADLAQTLDQLRHNLRPENVMEEVVSNARIGAGTLADTLYDLAKQNPLPALLVGAGAALFMGLGARGALKSKTVVDHDPAEPLTSLHSARELGERFPRMRDGSPSAPAPTGALEPGGLDAEYRATGFGDARERRLRPIRPGWSDHDDWASSSSRRMFARGRRSSWRAAKPLSGVLKEQPLILAALGIAVGAAIGSVLPSTRTEDEWMGPTSSSVRHAAQDAARAELDELRGVASRTTDNLKQTATDHGLSADNLNDLVRDVGGHATSAIHEMGGSLDQNRGQSG